MRTPANSMDRSLSCVQPGLCLATGLQREEAERYIGSLQIKGCQMKKQTRHAGNMVEKKKRAKGKSINEVEEAGFFK
jgi:hypothetical protein